MKKYKTYQEAKIDNPECDIYMSMDGEFATKEYVSHIHIALCGINEGWNLCYTSDHCMTMEQFFNSGHKLVDGDVYLDSYGEVCVVGGVITEKRVNIATESDKERYILKAKALDNPEVKPKEWANGDECNYDGRVWQFVSVLSDEFYGTAVIFDPSTEELEQVPLSSLRKPETKEHQEVGLNAMSNNSEIPNPSWAVYSIGDEVEKIKGSNWKGKIVGFYSTTLTPRGYAIESSSEKGSVQIYPESAIKRSEA